jgi:hypothetical protein
MEQLLYDTMLYLAAGINLMMAFVLAYGNYEYHYYDVYRRARLLSAAVFVAFAAGFLLHAQFQWRTLWPAGATALSVSYFHIGAVFFGWSHTSLIRPNYLTQRIVFRDILILCAGLAAYWIAAIDDESSIIQYPLTIMNGALCIFFLHAGYIALNFYRTYYQVRRSIVHRPAADMPWWTPEKKRTVLNRHHAFVIGCHLIIIFGLGSIAITAAFPHDIWPYTLLTAAGIAVFSYIFYALVEYGAVIDSATCATEDAANE